ncbi:RIP metalloprotease RseP [Faunimonas pinastri]|nr:RIP metalloprotease RseP [Faunimonas pinastri]
MEFLQQIWTVISGSVVPALAVLLVVVFVHEMGHFLTARWCGIRIAAFSLGFGPELAHWVDRRGTRWRLAAVPLGGYVRFEGDDNASSTPDFDALERLPAETKRGLFHFAPLWKRTAVVTAGPIANFILAILVFAALFATIGRPVSLPRADSVVAGSPAEKAGFKPGDLVLSINGEAVDSFSEMQEIVSLSAGSSLSILIQRAGEKLTLTATPERREMPDGLGGTQRVGVLGLSRTLSAGDVDYRRYGPIAALGQGVDQTWDIIHRTLTYVGRLFVGRESPDQLSGPVRVAQVSGVVAHAGGLPALIHLGAILSVSIGFINLFPVPMLDGGHLLFYAIEAMRGRPLSRAAQEVGFRIGFAMVVLLFVFVTFNDLSRLGGS